ARSSVVARFWERAQFSRAPRQFTIWCTAKFCAPQPFVPWKFLKEPSWSQAHVRSHAARDKSGDSRSTRRSSSNTATREPINRSSSRICSAKVTTGLVTQKSHGALLAQPSRHFDVLSQWIRRHKTSQLR